MKSGSGFPLSPGNLTACWRGVYYEKKQFPKPSLYPDIEKTLEHFRQLAELGQKFQRSLTTTWRQRGTLVEPERWLPDNQWNIRGKFDAICDNHGTPTLVEIKGAGDRFFEWYKAKQQPLPAHRLQVLTYLLIMRDQFPGLQPVVLYVNRATKTTLLLPVTWNENDLLGIQTNVEKLRGYLENDELPPPAENIVRHLITGDPDVNLTAITCRYHTLCTDDERWYPKAMQEAMAKELAADAAL